MDEKVEERIAEPTLITAREHLEEVAAEMRKASRLAVDIESNGFYAYRERVCLLQMSSPVEDFVVDPIAINDLSSLADLFANPRIEKIFHAGEYDVLCLKRDYGFRFANLFDTMIASRILGFKELGLAAAIERHFGVKLSKKLQRADWGRRPLTPEQIRYAQLDTHYLMRLSDLQKELLREKGREQDAAEAFDELTAVEPVIKSFDPEGYWKLAAREELSGIQLCCLKEIYHYREEQAASRNKAHFRVLPDELMLKLARAMPESFEAMKAVRGMTPYLVQKYGHGLMKAVQRGREAQPLEPPKRERRGERRDMREHKLFERLRQWRKEQAASENVEPVVIMSSDALKEIARIAIQGGDPLSPLSQLKRGRYEAALLVVLQEKD